MRRIFAFALVAALAVLGDAAIVGIGSAGAASHAKAHHSVAQKKKKKYVHKPAIKVKPSTNLTNGMVVTVSGTGYKKNATNLGINECADKGDQTQAGDCDLAATVVVKSNANGVIKPTKFTVKAGPFGGNNIVCTDAATAPNGCLLNLGELSADPNADQASVALKFSG